MAKKYNLYHLIYMLNIQPFRLKSIEKNFFETKLYSQKLQVKHFGLNDIQGFPKKRALLCV